MYIKIAMLATIAVAISPDEMLSRIAAATSTALTRSSRESTRVAALAVIERVIAASEDHNQLDFIAREAEAVVLDMIKFPAYVITAGKSGIDPEASTVRRIKEQCLLFRSERLVAMWLSELATIPSEGAADLSRKLSDSVDSQKIVDEIRSISRIEEKLEHALRFFSTVKFSLEGDAMISNLAAWRAQIAVMMRQDHSALAMQKKSTVSQLLIKAIRAANLYLLEQRSRLGLLVIPSEPKDFDDALNKLTWRADLPRIRKVYDSDDETSLVSILSFSVAVADITDPQGKSLHPAMLAAVQKWRSAVDKEEHALASTLIYKRAEQIKAERALREMEDALSKDQPPTTEQIDRWLAMLEVMQHSRESLRLLETLKGYKDQAKREKQLLAMQVTFIKSPRSREKWRPVILKARKDLHYVSVLSLEEHLQSLEAVEGGLGSISSPQLISEWKHRMYSTLFDTDDEMLHGRALIALATLEDTPAMEAMAASIDSSENLEVKIMSALSFFKRCTKYGLEMEAMIGHFFRWRSYLMWAMMEGEEELLLGERFDHVWQMAREVPDDVMLLQRSALQLQPVPDLDAFTTNDERLQALRVFTESSSIEARNVFTKRYSNALIASLANGHSVTLGLRGFEKYTDPVITRFLKENKRTLATREKRIVVGLFSGIDAKTPLGYLPHYMFAIWADVPVMSHVLMVPASPVTLSWPCLALESPAEFIAYVDARASKVFGNACRLGWISHLESMLDGTLSRADRKAANDLVKMLKHAASADHMVASILSLHDISIKLPTVLDILVANPGVYNAEVEAAIGVLCTWFSLLSHKIDNEVLPGTTSTVRDLKFRIGSSLASQRWAIDELHRKIGIEQVPELPDPQIDDYAPYLHKYFCQLTDKTILEKLQSRFKGKGEAVAVLMNSMLVILPAIEDLNLSEEVRWKLNHSMQQMASTVRQLLE